MDDRKLLELASKVAMLERALAASQAREARLRTGYVRILNANDSQMRDGDMAREVAGEMTAILPDDTALREMIEAERGSCIEDVRTVGGLFAVECEALIRARKA